MRMLSGAVVILAGSTLVGAGVIARAIAEASNKFSSGGDLTAAAGVVVGGIGLVVLASGFRSDPAARP
jgi:hypothetical protein